MIVVSGKCLSQKVCVGAWRTFASKVENEPYWRAKFGGRTASFNDIPTVTEEYDSSKWPEAAEKWFKKFGHVVKTPTSFGTYNVHLFHFDDFRTVYRHDGPFPIRQSHQAIAEYREERKHLYDSVGLGASQGLEWKRLRQTAARAMSLSASRKMAEDVADDLVKIIRNNLNDEGEIDLIPWLQRWALESIGVLALNRRLNILSEFENELAYKMAEAAALTDELIAATTIDPSNKYNERFRRLAEAQDYFYSVLRRYIDNIKRDIEMEPEMETAGSAQLMLQNEACTENDAITLIMDMFQGSLQTVTVTSLMTLYHIACNNAVQARAREEAKRIMPNKDSKYFDFKGPKDYIASVVYETLRLRPPIIGNGRVIQKDLVLGGYLVPAYTNVLLHYQVACRQEENFKEPLKFIPERGSYRNIMYVFGGSLRTCVGKGFATRQLLLIIAKMMRNFELSYDGGEVKTIMKLHNIPEKPVILRLKPIDE